MTILDLKDQIVKNNLGNFYIFVGEEIGIINIYLSAMSNKISLPITRADSVASIYSLCSSKSMFGTKTGFYVIRDDKDFPKQEKVFETIQKDIGKNVIVLLYDKIDGRSKLNKAFKDNIVVFEKLAPNIMKSYIKKEIDLSEHNMDTLVELCSGNYDMCMLEVDKIKDFKSITLKSAKECFAKRLADGTIYQPEDIDVFKLVEAVMNRNALLAYKLEATLREKGNSSVSMLGVLYTAFKSTLLIQCCPSGSNIAEVTGLDNGQIYFNRKYVGKYTSRELVDAIKLGCSVVQGIKSGWIEDEYATRYFIVKVLLK